jgi:hypothetical protein
MLDTLLEWLLHIKLEEVHINIFFANERFFLTDYIPQCYLNRQHFTYNWYNALNTDVPGLITATSYFFYQVTVHNKFSECTLPDSNHELMCPTMDFEQLYYQATVSNTDSVTSKYNNFNNISKRFRMKNPWWNCQLMLLLTSLHKDSAMLHCK